MELQVLIGLLLSIAPFFELRGGLPVIVEYVLSNGLNIWPYFYLVIFLNSIVTIVLFLFLDLFHEKFTKNKYYRRLAMPIIKRSREKSIKVEAKFKYLRIFALTLFVAIPLPGTGAWTGTLVAWTLGLNRVRSFIAITVGIIIAGLLVLLMSLGVFGSLYSIN